MAWIAKYDSQTNISNPLPATWEEVIRCKKRFSSGEDMKPEELAIIHPEVLKSWKRCRDAGVDPYHYDSLVPISKNSIKKAKMNNAQLVDCASSIIDSFQSIVEPNNYEIILYDLDYNALLESGPLEPLHGYMSGKTVNEEISGTNIHSIMKEVKCPLILHGPEHYKDIFADCSLCAVPLYNEYEEMFAMLMLKMPLIATPNDEHSNNLCLTLLGMLYSIAEAIANKMFSKKMMNNLKSTNNELKIMNHLLETTLNMIDEGLIYLDLSGNILEINQSCCSIFKSSREDIRSRNIIDYLSENTRLLKFVNAGKNVDIEELVSFGNHKVNCLINISPIKGSNQNFPTGAILRINPVAKVNAQALNHIGSVPRFHFEDIVGCEGSLRSAVEMAKLFAASNENILLLGESGTGKELFAQAVHNESFPGGPFVAINCAAMPRELIESELFGYVGGSFTGADRKGRPGKIELADGGTLFLDEIGDMPIELQAVLLRVLADKQVARVGSENYRQINFRLITATNKNLEKLISMGAFREDLFYRLSVLSINIPPLRHRKGDIAALCQHFINTYCNKQGITAPGISADTLNSMAQYDWPGNVRQLENAIIYAVNIAKGKEILPEHLKFLEKKGISDNNNQTALSEPVSLQDSENITTLYDSEKNAFLAAFAKANGNIPEAATILQVSKSTMYRRLRHYGIKY